jgi:hypothetical protein
MPARLFMISVCLTVFSHLALPSPMRKDLQVRFQMVASAAHGPARGFGGQRLTVFPEENMIAVFTGWEILKDEAKDRDLMNRILPAVRAQARPASR